jgi:hypothetical protein
MNRRGVPVKSTSAAANEIFGQGFLPALAPWLCARLNAASVLQQTPKMEKSPSDSVRKSSRVHAESRPAIGQRV